MKNNQILKVCQRCKAKCCKMGGPDFTEKEMKRVLKAGHKNYFTKIGKNHYELKSKRGICPYLAKNNSCSIHKIRPLMCRCWPVFADYKKGKRRYVVVECPLTPHLTKKQIQTMKKQASELPKEFIECFKTNLPKKEISLIMKRFKKFKKRKIK